jgi:hypothetical protein
MHKELMIIKPYLKTDKNDQPLLKKKNARNCLLTIFAKKKEMV